MLNIFSSLKLLWKRKKPTEISELKLNKTLWFDVFHSISENTHLNKLIFDKWALVGMYYLDCVYCGVTLGEEKGNLINDSWFLPQPDTCVWNLVPCSPKLKM